MRSFDYITVIVFSAEAALKIATAGFVRHKLSYLRESWWNRLDVVLVIAAIVDLGLGACCLGRLGLVCVLLRSTSCWLLR